MAKNKNAKISISDFFGTSKDYYLFGIKSFHSLFRLGANLGESLNSEFTYLDHITIQELPTLEFPLLYAKVSEMENIDVAILENKTTHSSHFNTINKEKKLTFRTLSLFEDYYYIFNKKGLKLYYTPHLNIDYLLLLFTEKGRDISSILSAIESTPKITLHDMSEVLVNMHLSSTKKSLNFIRNLFCEIQVKSTQLLQKKEEEKICGVRFGQAEEVAKHSLFLRQLVPPLTSDYLECLHTETAEELFDNSNG